jgi:hypothetical protein
MFNKGSLFYSHGAMWLQKLLLDQEQETHKKNAHFSAIVPQCSVMALGKKVVKTLKMETFTALELSSCSEFGKHCSGVYYRSAAPP